MNIDNADGKYEISDFGRVLTILRAELENEGKYTCKHSGKNETVFLNVTCKISVKIYIFNLLKKNGLHDFTYFHKNHFGTKTGMYSETSDRNLQLLPF